MSENVTNLFEDRTEQMIKEMTGPGQVGNSVIIEGHVIPNLTMIDRGEMIELRLDGRMSWEFPRALAWQAADFAATAMAIGAGYPHFKHPKTAIYATPCFGISIEDLPA